MGLASRNILILTDFRCQNLMSTDVTLNIKEYLPLGKVADTPFHIQGHDMLPRKCPSNFQPYKVLDRSSET